nr:uncharacterized protein LOC129258632 [Lytechinus pictus]
MATYKCPQKSDVFHKLLSSELHPGQTKSNELELRPLHFKCSCGNLKNRKPGIVLPIQSSSSSSSSSDESEDEGENDEQDQRGYDVADLIKLLIIQETKQGPQRLGSILRNLARSVTIGEDVTEVQLHQLLRLLTSHIGCVREAALLTLKQAGKISHLASMLLESGALGRVVMLLHGEDEGVVIIAGCQFLEEITSHNALKDLWLEEMIVTGLTVLIGLLSRDGRSQATTSVQSERAAACLLSKLANHLQLGIMMLDHGMDDIEVAFRKQSAIREPITELLTNLIRHNDHTAGGVLNYKFTSLVAVALRDGPCCVQCKAMDFCRELCMYEAGIHALIKDTMLLATCLQVLKSTNCRYVRRLGTSTLDALLRGSNTRQLQAFFNQTDLAFNERTQVHLDPNRRRAKDVWIPLTKQTFEIEYGDGDQEERKGVDEKEKKMKSGVKEIVDLVVHVILVEGKIHTDEKSNVTDVRFRPTHDDISCLQEAVNCLKSLANMSEAIMSSNSSHRLLVSHGSLCLIDLLHTFSATVFGFTNCVTPDTDRQQRNPEALYLQASMKLWQGATKRTDSIVDVQEFYDKSKLSFVRSVLEFLLGLAEASCNRWSRQLVRQLEEQVLESTNWIEDGSDSTALPAQYKYIESIGQAFHDRRLPNSRGVKEQRSKVKFAWDENNDHNFGVSALPCGPKPHGSNSNNSNNKSNNRRHNNQWETSVKGNGYEHGNGDDLEVSQRRQLVVKKALVRGGVCETVSSWMACGEERLEEVACDVIQCVIQPQDPEEIHRFATESSKQLNPAQRHHARAQEMADSLAQRDALLSKILSQMSMETADLVSDSLLVKGQDGVKGYSEVKKDEKPKISKKKRKDDDATSVSSTSTSATASKLRNKHSVSAYKPTVKSDKPLAYQTSLTVLDVIGKQLVKSLSHQSSSDVKRKQLLVLYDLVAHGDVVMHMTLASYGLHSYLIQYIQKNVQYSVNILICLTILRNMMGDQRIKQLFISEGGEKFLQRVVKATKGAVKLHAERFLSFLSQGATGLVWS